MPLPAKPVAFAESAYTEAMGHNPANRIRVETRKVFDAMRDH